MVAGSAVYNSPGARTEDCGEAIMRLGIRSITIYANTVAGTKYRGREYGVSRCTIIRSRTRSIVVRR